MITTNYINEKSAYYFLRANDLSRHHGKPFNLFVTISFDCKNSKQHYQKVFSLINRAKNVWIRNYNNRNGLPREAPRSACVFENPHFNVHAHWEVYIPSQLIEKFKEKLPRWLKRYQGVIHDDSIDIQHINPHTLKTVANYMIKGIKPEWKAFYHLQSRAAYQGAIQGQRVKLSRNLGRTALKRSGFNAATQRNEWETLYPELSSQYSKPANWSIEEVIPQVATERKFPSMKEFRRMLWKKERQRYLSSTSISTGSSARLNAQIVKQLGYSVGSIENRDW
ncbi:hypothetical protein [Brucella anthropi]|uniref:Uncharacterized protein n=1 Tax=Brucella anthropi (strain ATCC 49188 / DSM 6882 / CCUG 24695 / JCM 21032 / LMG 3331 / NBRC 15819 / NCTC 12168 / Alc 37) TaxID=439375 RepID=A6WYH1_BRUA4|nr:hypothetical protein [Brucella anthropi]ABS14025.1 hypothetical protein Oant_1308 [Brucella anthropi ATCC 49188]AIK44075.1 hypothetical protein DR92_870 [Brucella anthropi]KAB2753138.1 hypothetical protein F9K95_04640 [Brucella anthropi]KAB2784011.1 hypothetical protein F9K99_05735 [Brucella anthropi]QQC25554.1 hypothetical protein I6H96_01455 [Brucella anthropi]